MKLFFAETSAKTAAGVAPLFRNVGTVSIILFCSSFVRVPEPMCRHTDVCSPADKLPRKAPAAKVKSVRCP